MIKCTAGINFGMPSLEGRRISVFNLVTIAYYSNEIELTMLDYKIPLADVRAALDYCINLQCKTDIDRVHFCDGCILRTIDEGFNFNKDDYIEMDLDGQKIVKSKDEKVYFLGSLQEFEDTEFGMVGWLLAEDVYERHTDLFSAL